MDNRIRNLNDNNEPFKASVVQPHQRKYTDCGCCILVGLLIAIDIILFVVAITKHSNPSLLIYGHDYQGTPCKYPTKYVAWPSVNHTDITVCIAGCYVTNSDSSNFIVPYPSEPYVDHFCLPKEWIDNDSTHIDDVSSTYVRTIADLWTARYLVAISFVSALLISSYYIRLIFANRRGFAYLVMNCIFGSILALILIIRGIHGTSDNLQDDTAMYSVSLGVFILFFVCIVSCLIHSRREEIMTEIEMMVETNHAIKQNKRILVFISFYSFIVLVWAVYWIIAAVFIYAVPHKTQQKFPDIFYTQEIVSADETHYTKISLSDYQYWIIFHFVVLYVVTYIIIYFCWMVIGAVIGTWYLERNERVSVLAISIDLCKNSGTAAWAAIRLPLGDIYDFFMNKIRRIIVKKRTMRALHFNADEQPESRRQSTIYQRLDDLSHEMKAKHEERKLRMYEDIKVEIFPLIEDKIETLAYEETVSCVIDEKMKNITKKHLYGSVFPKSSDSDDEEDEKMDILDIVRQNMKKFEYEADLKEDVMQIIDQEIKSLKSMVEEKAAHHQLRQMISIQRINEVGDSMSDGLLSPRPSNHAAEDDTRRYDIFSKEGLLFTAIYGTSWCYSSRRASKLLKRNETRLNVDGASKYNELFGRIGIASFNTSIVIIAYLIYYSFSVLNPLISTTILPALIVFVTSYTIAALFTMVLEATARMLLLCVLLDEQKWQTLFTINQGKIKENVSKLGNKLSAILSEHLLVMQLKGSLVNLAIEKQLKQYLDEKHGVTMTVKKYEERKLMQRRLLNAKKSALQTERELLVSIDGAMKLTEYLINVILVENLFNGRYCTEKFQQEKSRQKYAEGNLASDIRVFEQMGKPKCQANINSFLKFFPCTEEEEKRMTKAWKAKFKKLELELKKHGVKFESGGAKKKGIERAFYKSFYGYHHKSDGYRYLTDVLRCSLIFDDFDNLYRCFKVISTKLHPKEFQIQRVKDRFNSVSEPCGYRDLMVNVLPLNVPEIEGIVCEIQLHHNIFYEAKKISHKMYKRTRLFMNEDGVNEAYKYAKKYIRPTIGRLKVYPFREEKETQQIQMKSNIERVIESKIKKLAEKYCVTHVLPHIDRKYDNDLSVLVTQTNQYEPPLFS